MQRLGESLRNKGILGKENVGAGEVLKTSVSKRMEIPAPINPLPNTEENFEDDREI